MTCKSLSRVLCISILLALSACNKNTPPDMRAVQATDADINGFTAPTAATLAVNKALESELSLANQQDFSAAMQGFVGGDVHMQITHADGSPLWQPASYDFIKNDAPASVNPSLWRQEKLNNIRGLFKVHERVYQVRGYDLANMTIIEGEHGRILVDPLTATETARAALQLVEKHLGARPIVAVIFTHSHVDHFGGIDAVLPHDKHDASAVRLIAPRGFMEESVSENILAGSVMMRRASYMYGSMLPHTDRGHVGTGLGKEPAIGQMGLASPTELIDHTGQTLAVDGVDFEFQSVPGSEAPAEMTFFLPQFHIFCGAELLSHTMHNLYTLRGAKVRDALRWSNYIQEALDRFGSRSELIINSHHWPVWGNAEVLQYLKLQRDLYKYLHDQTLRLANQGHTPDEIAEELTLPPSLAQAFFNRGYYGTLRHNVRAVYQFYFGWYDSNPAHLNPLPAAATAPRYVEAMGGAAAVLTKARLAFDQGDYRWAAELLNHLVFSDPQNASAREALARCYDQLGYQAESGPWRDEYLSAALELRKGILQPAQKPDRDGILRQIPVEQYFNAIAVLINGPKAEGKHLVVNFNFTDVREQHVVWIENAVLHHRQSEADSNADFSISLTLAFWIKLLNKQVGVQELLSSNEYSLQGDKLALVNFLALLDKPDEAFAIVTP